MTSAQRTVRVAAISVEPPWPAINGGRVRTANVLEALSSFDGLDVHVFASHVGDEPAADETLPCTRHRVDELSRVAGLLSPHAKVAKVRLSPALGALREWMTDLNPQVLWCSHSYVTDLVPQAVSIPVITEFQNIETERYRSFATGAALSIPACAEWLKAKRWEPRVARRSDLAVALTERDAATLAGKMGANHVMLVPNGVRHSPSAATPSSNDSTVLFFGSMTYRPNRDAARWLAHLAWPGIRKQVGSARLVLAGRGASSHIGDLAGGSVEVHSDVEDIANEFEQATVVVAPVQTGGGAQLKVIDALAHGRIVVATPFSAASAPMGAVQAGCVVVAEADDFPEVVVRLLGDRQARHHRERQIASVVQTWTSVVQPLAEWIRAVG